MRICTAKLYIGSGLRAKAKKTSLRIGKWASKHRLVIDPQDIVPVIEHTIEKHFPMGSTITEGRGRWLGDGEPAVVVEVWDSADNKRDFFKRAAKAAQELVDALDQITVATVLHDEEGRQHVGYFGSAEALAAFKAKRKSRFTTA